MPRTGKHGAGSQPVFQANAPPEEPSLRSRGRVQWADLCNESDLAGHWVALDPVRYDNGEPLDGELVDADLDLSALCARVQSVEGSTCAILYCEAKSRRSLS